MPLHIPKSSNRLQFFRSNWKLVTSFIGSGLGIGWLADAINDGPLFAASWFWSHCWLGPACISSAVVQTGIGVVFALGLSIVSGFFLITQIGGGTVVQLDKQKLRAHKVLIMWLSAGKECIETLHDGSRRINGIAGQAQATLSHDPDADALNSNTTGWNMWQHLRAVKPHAKELLALHMLVTPGERGSAQRYELAKDLFQHYLGLKPAIIHSALEINEQDIQSQIDAIHRLIEDIKARMPGIQDRDIMVDCTGGLKLSSIAAACATLNNDIELQYVNTNTNKVETYQLVYMAPRI